MARTAPESVTRGVEAPTRQPLETVVGPAETRQVLQAVASRGRFFDLLGPTPDDPTDWHPFEELSGPHVPQAVSSALADLGGYLGSAERRTVASLLQMSAAAQLTAPSLAAAAEFGVVPLLELQHLVYGFTSYGGFRARLVETPGGLRGDTAPLALAMSRQLTDGPLTALTAAISKLVPLSPHTTNGNVASSLAAASRLLTAEQPAVGAHAHQLVAALLQDPPLKGAGVFSPAEPPATDRSFRRRNCCFFYRLPGGGTCADCILTS